MKEGRRDRRIAGWLLTVLAMVLWTLSLSPALAGEPEAGETDADQLRPGQTVQLPGSPWAISVPADMKYSGPRDGDGTCVFAYWLPGEAAESVRMEIDFFIYASEGMNLADAAQAMAEAGMDVELRDVGGIEMICGVSRDPADGAPCISYGMLAGENIVEVVFWCADQEAADLSKVIMESIRTI